LLVEEEEEEEPFTYLADTAVLMAEANVYCGTEERTRVQLRLSNSSLNV
jgi:hypothetical protein